MPSRHGHGFTLIELLVAMAILGTLLSLALTSIGMVQAYSRSMHCQSNLKQLSLAVSSYRNTYQGSFPAAYLMEVVPGSGLQTIAWDFVNSGDGSVQPGTIWSYTDHPHQVHQCPEFDGDATFGNDPSTGYNYNTTYIGAEGHYPTTGPDGTILDGWDAVRLGVPSAAIRKTSTTALFGDAGWAQGANKFMRAPGNSCAGNLQVVYAGGQAFRHQHRCNVCYIDGHIDAPTQSHEGIHATEALLQEMMNHPHNGFLSNDDAAYDPR